MLFSVDILMLLSQGHYSKWNEFLTDCLDKNDINRLTKVRKELQEDMAKLAKDNVNSERVNVFFCRLVTSIEKTIRRILKKVTPNPKDNPLIAKSFGVDALKEKRKRDKELETWLKEQSY